MRKKGKDLNNRLRELRVKPQPLTEQELWYVEKMREKIRLDCMQRAIKSFQTI